MQQQRKQGVRGEICGLRGAGGRCPGGSGGARCSQAGVVPGPVGGEEERKKTPCRGVEGNAVWVGKAAGRARVCRERGKRGEEG